jgi:hypothetical protein
MVSNAQKNTTISGKITKYTSKKLLSVLGDECLKIKRFSPVTP